MASPLLLSQTNLTQFAGVAAHTMVPATWEAEWEAGLSQGVLGCCPLCTKFGIHVTSWEWGPPGCLRREWSEMELLASCLCLA